MEREELAWHLPLTLSFLRRIRDEALADDTPIDAERMARWSRAEARAHFESGGGGSSIGSSGDPEEDLPAPSAAEPALQTLLASGPPALREGDDLASLVGAHSLAGWSKRSRPEVLAELKRLGVSKLTQRQAFANAIGKHAREQQQQRQQQPSEEPAVTGAASDGPRRPPALAPLAVLTTDGLCNRLRVTYSFLAFAQLEGRRLLIEWPVNDSCPGRYEDIFEVPHGVEFVEKLAAGCAPVYPPPGHDFHPHVKHTPLEVSMYSVLRPTAAVRRDVERNVIELGSSASCGQSPRERGDCGACGYASVAIRRTDHWGCGISDEEFAQFLLEQPEGTRAYVATDNAATQALLASRLGERLAPCHKRIRTPASSKRLRHTTLHDAAVDLLTCACADGPFKGSFQSSFSDTIGRLRRLHGRTHARDQHIFADAKESAGVTPSTAPWKR